MHESSLYNEAGHEHVVLCQLEWKRPLPMGENRRNVSFLNASGDGGASSDTDAVTSTRGGDAAAPLASASTIMTYRGTSLSTDASSDGLAENKHDFLSLFFKEGGWVGPGGNRAGA